jgi:hypothetical protein
LAVDPTFDAMGMAEAIELNIGRDDVFADPAVFAIGLGFGTGAHHAREILIDGDGEPPTPKRAGQRAGQMEAIQRQHAASLGFDPIDIGIVATFSHGKNTGAIGAQQNVRVQ